jgi:micrococcal nuclease
MIWIDAPESSVTRYWYKECYWEDAKNYLKNLIEWKTVKLEYDSTQWEIDKYWRSLIYVMHNWLNINWEMIKNWYAWEYTYNKAYKYQSDFKENQKNASDNKVWLWWSWTCNWERLKINKIIESWTWSNSTTIINNSEKNIRTYYLWPKGWCYYINSSWDKSYVDSNFCN